MARKLTDADVARIRELAVEGRSVSELADQFGVTRRHIGRLLRNEQRAQLGGLDADLARDSVVRATERFIDGLELDAAEQVHAQAAVALARKLDAVRDSDLAAAAGAAPALARELLQVVADLRGDVLEPDTVDELNQRRAARRLALGMPA